MLELHIRFKDWLGVLGLGVFFSGLLTGFFYLLLELPFVHGLGFGTLLGGWIALGSWGLFSVANRFIMPKISPTWWVPLSAFIAFLAGFLGTLLAVSFPLGLLLPAKLPHLETALILGVLTYLLGALLYHLVKLRNINAHLDTLLLQSRLKSLETQLNPHFLFNALNSLAELYHVNPEKAEAMVLKLSTFLRNTMQENALLSLAQELENTRAYVEIEAVRFGGNITLHCAIPEALTSHLVPKFSIQLLVENAIKHGFKGTPFEIHITASQHQKALHVKVENTGPIPQNPTYGIGLSNLSERLKHLCHGSLVHSSSTTASFTLILGAPHAHFNRR
ncbi:MAG: histidine kinase [Campylobacterales bacterium]|nr:histidine kinase [Campylobacterales bacterium]